MNPYPVLILIVTCTFCANAQKQKYEELTPARGYYKALQTFDSKAKSAAKHVDTLKFPYDSASAERRLSLKPYYLEGVSLKDFHIADPPANSSEQTRAELNYLLKLQNSRAKAEVDASLHMAGVFYSLKTKPEDPYYSQYRQNLFHVGKSIGTWFNPHDLPLTAELIAHVWQDASYFIWSAKYKYLRVRPYVLDEEIKNLEETNWAAYPSGHAANSYVNAYIYQELAPEFADVFIKDAYDMAHSRELIGVHYPSDSEAGRVLARQLVNRLFQNEKFLKDFDLVKKEWAAKAHETFVKPAVINTEKTKSASCEAKPSKSECAKTCQ